MIMCVCKALKTAPALMNRIILTLFNIDLPALNIKIPYYPKKSRTFCTILSKILPNKPPFQYSPNTLSLGLVKRQISYLCALIQINDAALSAYKTRSDAVFQGIQVLTEERNL